VITLTLIHLFTSFTGLMEVAMWASGKVPYDKVFRLMLTFDANDASYTTVYPMFEASLLFNITTTIQGPAYKLAPQVIPVDLVVFAKLGLSNQLLFHTKLKLRMHWAIDICKTNVNCCNFFDNNSVLSLPGKHFRGR
jgi:hypothetical protein